MAEHMIYSREKESYTMKKKREKQRFKVNKTDISKYDPQCQISPCHKIKKIPLVSIHKVFNDNEVNW